MKTAEYGTFIHFDTVSPTKTHEICAYEPCKEKFAMVGRNDKYCCAAHRTAAANERRKGKR